MATPMTTGAPWRVLVVFALPLLVGNVIQQLYQFTDAVVVGRHLGVNALAAVGSTTSLVFLLIGFAWGLTTGFAIPTAQAYGAGDARGVPRSVVAGTVLTAATSVILTIAGNVFVVPALQLLQTPPELIAQAAMFARVTFCGVTVLMFFNFLAAIIRAIGDSRTPLVFLVLSCALNVVLVIVLVRHAGLGVAGAALSTSLAQATSVALCLLYIRHRVPVLLPRREDWRVTRSELIRPLRLGLPFGFQTSIIALGSVIMQVRLNDLGPEAVAAFTTASRVDGLAVAFLQSLGLAISMFAAQNVGARRPDRVRQGVVQGLGLALVCSLAIGAVILAAGGRIVGLFLGTTAPEVIALAEQLLGVYASLYCILGVLFVLRGALQGLGYTAIPLLTGLMELLMRIGTATILGGMFGFAGVIWGTPLAWTGAVLVLVPAYLRARRYLQTRAPTQTADSSLVASR